MTAKKTSEPGPAPVDTEPLDAAPLNYEQARAELEDVVRRLEQGGVPLEESLALWERGEALAGQCQEWLDGARRRLADASKPDADAPPAD